MLRHSISDFSQFWLPSRPHALTPPPFRIQMCISRHSVGAAGHPLHWLTPACKTARLQPDGSRPGILHLYVPCTAMVPTRRRSGRFYYVRMVARSTCKYPHVRPHTCPFLCIRQHPPVIHYALCTPWTLRSSKLSLRNAGSDTTTRPFPLKDLSETHSSSFMASPRLRSSGATKLTSSGRRGSR